uniref:Uncharacterized protein n=1 Tax=Neobodo designis TaxID=312471 RepID=A0A6U4WLD5_NEODS
MSTANGERATYSAFHRTLLEQIHATSDFDKTSRLIGLLEDIEAAYAQAAQTGATDWWHPREAGYLQRLDDILATPDAAPIRRPAGPHVVNNESSSNTGGRGADTVMATLQARTDTAINAVAAWWMSSRIRSWCSGAVAGVGGSSAIAYVGLQAGQWVANSGVVQSYFVSSAATKVCDTLLALPRSIVDPFAALLAPTFAFATRHSLPELAALGGLGWAFLRSHRNYTEIVRAHANDFSPDDDDGEYPQRRRPATVEMQRALWMHHATTAAIGAAFCAVAFSYVRKTLWQLNDAARATGDDVFLTVRPDRVRLAPAHQEHLALVYREPLDAAAGRSVSVVTVNNTDLVEGARVPGTSGRAASGWRGDELRLSGGEMAVVKGCHGVGLPKDMWRTALYVYDGQRCGFVKIPWDGAHVNVSALLPHLSLVSDRCANLTHVVD